MIRRGKAKLRWGYCFNRHFTSGSGGRPLWDEYGPSGIALDIWLLISVYFDLGINFRRPVFLNEKTGLKTT